MNKTFTGTCPKCSWEDWPKSLRWTLMIPVAAVSQNQLGGYGRGRSGWKYRSVKRAYQQAVDSVVSRQSIPKATGFRRALLTRYYKKGCRAFDVGNLVGGFKPLVDALVQTSLLKDDSPRWYAGYYSQLPSKTGKHYVEVVLEELYNEKKTNVN